MAGTVGLSCALPGSLADVGNPPDKAGVALCRSSARPRLSPGPCPLPLHGLGHRPSDGAQSTQGQ